MSNEEFEKQCAKAIKEGLIMGLVGFVLLLGAVYGSGASFGQQCSKKHQTNSVEWSQCVSSKANGR